ncbi:hypothetical protein EC843_104135 [Buttiauxella sp. JUb87]|nr:hypothetical protein EC843_104135 [Buttiauxella sp. JUb87]
MDNGGVNATRIPASTPNGHLPEFYSVAQHSVLCSQLVAPEFAFEALMHDAAEAYCQDIPAPLKTLLPDYQRIETFVDGLIRFKYNLPPKQSAVVKYADLTMLATERRDLDIDDGMAENAILREGKAHEH